ncbi:MAG: imidazole glycerol phosphate synthase subunit HisF [candidate division KSB1 bacterium]|nr:imidazole glycerol phosphate synthase subunit HisF [candidate division KSB1 bacterium]MDQ7064971.1 imidazole glycerol phosphate synthase subunit HisF [candidate division KSB1 bacterium]
MLAKRVIPCLDVDAGRVVKGTNFVNLVDAGDPVEQAKYYDDEGADELVFLDITATADRRAILIEMVKQVAAAIHVPFTVGGGVRTVDDMRDILRAGADKISINSAAVAYPELIAAGARAFGSQCVVVAIDAKWHSDHWRVYTHGGRRATELDAVEWALEAEQRGAGELLVTSMDRDGTKDGFDVPLLRAITERVNIPVIASGGAGKPEHFIEAIQNAGVDAVLAASLFHFRQLRIRDLKEAMKHHGIPVRTVS